ncbi:hypothetical protein [Flavobacterium pectinovorum]|uniref:hypothetical protein n=1 Tax=Flavobacterium pectinovorum TaxID=29533 RepID=UPI001FAD03C5|nr:hypothetical protein [Flavobacterium pectinovorum]
MIARVPETAENGMVRTGEMLAFFLFFLACHTIAKAANRTNTLLKTRWTFHVIFSNIPPQEQGTKEL